MTARPFTRLMIFFIGQKTHVSARYRIQFGDRSEFHSSSGIIVSTGLGSSGWLKSILVGAMGISGTVTNSRIDAGTAEALSWDSDFLCFSVREPFPSKTTGIGIVFGRIDIEQPLIILSQMAENGVIFSDGIESDFLSFNSGIEATITVAENKGKLVV